MNDTDERVCTVSATDRSMAAGRDININTCDLRERLMAHADDPRLGNFVRRMLREQLGETKCCHGLRCEPARDAVQTRAQPIFAAGSDLQILASAVMALTAVGLLLHMWPRALGTPFDTLVGGLALVVLLCCLLDCGLIAIIVWFRCDVSRWMVEHRLGWLLGRYD